MQPASEAAADPPYYPRPGTTSSDDVETATSSRTHTVSASARDSADVRSPHSPSTRGSGEMEIILTDYMKESPEDFKHLDIFVGSARGSTRSQNPSREKRIVRFGKPGQGPPQPLISNEVPRSSAELGMYPPRFSESPRTNKVRSSAERKFSVTEQRRSRVLELKSDTEYAEHLLKEARVGKSPAKGAKQKDQNHDKPFSRMRIREVQYLLPVETGLDELKPKDVVRSRVLKDEVRDASLHTYPTEKELQESASSRTAHQMGVHQKLDPWYQDLTSPRKSKDFRSDAIFLEMKMQELMGDKWPDRKSDPDAIRVSVCCDMLGRILQSTPATGKLGMVMLDELILSIFQNREGHSVNRKVSFEAAGTQEDLDSSRSKSKGNQSTKPKTNSLPSQRWGDTYFDLAKKLKQEVAELRETVKGLRKEFQTPEDIQNEKMAKLMSKVVGRVGQQSFTLWKAITRRNNSWKVFQRQLKRKYRTNSAPRFFFKWMASAEQAKRERWQSIAEMLKWERDYGHNAEGADSEVPTSISAVKKNRSMGKKPVHGASGREFNMST